MRLPIITVITSIITGILLGWYIIRTLRHSGHRSLATGYTAVGIIMLLELVIAAALPFRSGSANTLVAVMWMLYAYLTFYMSSLLFCIASVAGKIPRLWKAHPLRGTNTVAAVLAIITLAVMWWGALINRFNIVVERIDLYYDNLPEAFDGIRIVQFSDLHVGTYGDSDRYVSTVVDTINSLNPDVILFTGDIVNRRTDELPPFTEALARLHAPFGVYSVLGNHDYGDYSSWSTSADKQSNLDRMLDLQKQMGWSLLNNSHSTLHCGTDSIVLVGVENWGEPPFSTYGDLDKAYPTLSDSTFKILLTHNPMHWLHEIEPDSTARVDLTLSGHTHAMQLEIGHWSPSKWRYPIYDGLYTATDSVRHIYVSRGIGTVGIPARIGAAPALTLITLHRKP